VTLKEEIEDLRTWFDPHKSAKTNILNALEAYLENQGEVDMHYQADVALLALINDPDVTEAFIKINRYYDPYE
jgi:hypothetical protein